jgi:SAM-dependent methyltransferase
MNDHSEIKDVVQDKYNQIARTEGGCCGSSPCNVGESYKDIDGYVKEADLGLGCGLPTEHAAIKPGDTVVDLGSGAGNDVFIARKEVGDTGKVIGVDFARDMITKAEANRSTLGYTNVEFLHGDLEKRPLENQIADVVVSNCVLNLVPDKAAAYAETYRILKPGGHFSISDVVLRGSLPSSLREAAELYVGCVSGAIPEKEYLEIISKAGFKDITVRKEHRINPDMSALREFLTDTQIDALQNADAGIYSVTINATKPAKACCGSSCCT